MASWQSHAPPTTALGLTIKLFAVSNNYTVQSITHCEIWITINE